MFQHIRRSEQTRLIWPTMRFQPLDRKLDVAIYNYETKQTKHVKVTEDIVIDFPSSRHGQERFIRGQKYNVLLVPITEPLPEPPDEHHLPIGAIKVIVASLGICEFLVDNDYIADQLSELFAIYKAAPEAKNNMVPFCKFRAESFEIVDWLERDPKYFGKPIVDCQFVT